MSIVSVGDIRSVIWSDPTPGERELFLCFGTQFEANMMNRQRWLSKLTDPANTLVVVDPIPDPWTEAHAELILPSPPHPATAKVYQNGEWRLSLSTPQKRQAPETRSDATILYDVMAAICRRLSSEPGVAGQHADLARHLPYMIGRFSEPGLARIEGEALRGLGDRPPRSGRVRAARWRSTRTRGN